MDGRTDGTSSYIEIRGRKEDEREELTEVRNGVELGGEGDKGKTGHSAGQVRSTKNAPLRPLCSGWKECFFPIADVSASLGVESLGVGS